MKLGVVGLGVIGKAVVKAADEGKIPVDIPVAATRTPEKVKDFLASLKNPPRMTDMAGVAQEAEVVMEASGGGTVEAICHESFARGKDVIINSVGALLDRNDLLEEAKSGGSRIFVPSGAIIGLDGLKGASAGGMESVTMTTRKPPESLKGAPYIEAQGIDLDAIDEPTVIFEGNPLEACKAFPANVNVSAAVSFAGIGPHRTKLRVVCDPTVNRNIHEVEAVGEFGRSFIRIENVPSENHRTGILTYLSAFSFLRDRTSTLIVGT
ncbi:MAG: aspartate dehydrogenase [Nitrospinae bacterium]|nr:aspartate dehydrogenase [Nitrospinota bacterium]